MTGWFAQGYARQALLAGKVLVAFSSSLCYKSLCYKSNDLHISLSVSGTMYSIPCQAMAQASYLLTVKTISVILDEWTPTPSHANEIIRLMSHLHLMSTPNPSPHTHTPHPALAWGRGQFGHHHWSTIHPCLNQGTLPHWDFEGMNWTAAFIHSDVLVWIHAICSCFSPSP